MTGAPRNGTDADTRRGTATALKTIYHPELTAQAQFDGLIEKLKAEPGTMRKVAKQ